MSAASSRPRVVPPGTTVVPVHPAGYRPPVAYALLGLVAAAVFLLALVGSPTGFRLLFAGVGVLVLAALGVAVATARAVTPGTIRLDRDAVGLRFTPVPTLRLSWALLAIVGVVVGALPVLLDAAGLAAGSTSVVTRFSPLLIGIAALVWLVLQVVALSVPSGLTLTPVGLSGVRGAGRLDLPWAELAEVEVVDVRGARIVLRSTSGASWRLDGRMLGSDPNLVAAIIRHFLTHAADRAALTDPGTAVERVEAAVSPRA